MNRVIAAIAGFPWAILALFGLSSVGVPDKATYYFYLPLAIFAAVIAALVTTRHSLERYFAYLTFVLALLALPFYLFFYTGGV